ncbi:hypothetical protein BACI71_110643 [Bacillus mycoides]|jgi:hypothetical protein|uniref:Uncharacterized protein n=1 Tax=Bacillus mycoides TaxID=1405 RepID=A0A653R5F0_BACMY|nr:hypothetical protein BACI71_110643 [Bacillus mycoides]
MHVHANLLRCSPLIVHCLHGKHERECLPESSRSEQQVSEENEFRRVYDKNNIKQYHYKIVLCCFYFIWCKVSAVM